MESMQPQDYGQPCQLCPRLAELATKSAEHLHQVIAWAENQQSQAEQQRQENEVLKAAIQRLEYDKLTLSNVNTYLQREAVMRQRLQDHYSQAIHAGEQRHAPLPSLIHNEPPIQEQWPERGTATAQQL
jgi:predicted phage gp36 major capsid-like protein